MDKNKLINELLETLFAPEKRRLAGVITELNKTNKQLKNLSADGFIYGGIVYMPSGVSTTVVGPGQAKNSLDFSLYDEMERWLKDSKTVFDDQSLIRQMLFLLLWPCQKNRDIRDTLPDCLVSLIPDLKQHPRSLNPGWTLDHNERARKQFDKLLPKMELYSAARLFY